MPIKELVDVLKQGADDQGFIDSKMPGLSQAMIELINSREFWFNERQSIETIARDLGDPNIFSTFNMDARHWEDVRWLVFQLEKGKSVDWMERDGDAFKNWYPSTKEWTDLKGKHSPLVTIFLHHRFTTFFKAFFCDICKVPEQQPRDDYTKRPNLSCLSNGWYWTRVEFTEVKGVQHHHCLVRLPKVLETGRSVRLNYLRWPRYKTRDEDGQHQTRKNECRLGNDQNGFARTTVCH